MKKGVDNEGTGWYIGKAVGETGGKKPPAGTKKVLDKAQAAW